MLGLRRLPMTALIPADAAVLPLQGLDLRREHGLIHEQTMRKHKGGTPSARVFVVDILAIDRGKRHALDSC